MRKLPERAALERRTARPPVGDTKPTQPPPSSPPRMGNRKASIARAAAIIAKAEHTSVEAEEQKLVAIMEAGLL